jgi:glycine C-acetyltransferase
MLGKCARFADYVREADAAGFYRTHYRLELLGPLDHRITVRDPLSGQVRELICFDSNSYLGLHLDPRVIAASQAALAKTGIGTPSAQLLSGTHRWLRELEETVADFHQRPAAIIFSSGYAANIGTITGLARPGDLVVRDTLSHASIADGARWAGATAETFRHRDRGALEQVLARHAGDCQAKLVVSDGVFSMHGHLAPLRDLRQTATAHGARLMIDEAHSVGVIGPTGRGLEELFAMPNSIDIVMGTFSKAPGAFGGYVCGSEDLVTYLRFFARSSMFTASMPPSVCAGLTEAFRIFSSESEHRERLWENARRLHRGLSQVGFALEPLESPIIAVPVGSMDCMFGVGRALYDAGIKCGTVGYPAVSRHASLIRMSVNARHRADDIDRTVDEFAAIARRFELCCANQTAASHP